MGDHLQRSQLSSGRCDIGEAQEDPKDAPPVRLWRVDVNSGDARRLTTNNDWIEKLALAPDGRHAVVVHGRSLRYRYDQNIRPATFLYDFESGAETRLFADERWVPSQVAWAPDSTGFYFSAPYSTHPVYLVTRIELLYYYDLGARRATQVNLYSDRGLGFGIAPLRDGFLALLADGVRPKLARLVRSGPGWLRWPIESEHAGNIFELHASLDGRTIVYKHSGASTPTQWCSATLDGRVLRDVKPLTDLNPGLKKKTIARTEIVHWKGARGEEVEGIVYYPHQYQQGQRYSLVVIIHGGPDYYDVDDFNEGALSPSNLIAQRGAFVLKVNYHGSTLYGLPWAESIAGHYNELEPTDIQTGVDALIAKGLVDPDKLALWGWSAGAILSIELTTLTTRYKAAVVGAGDVDWITDWSNCDYGDAFGQYYIGKTPLDDIQLLLRKSALFRLDNVRTPTLIMFGGEDRDVPMEQGWEHFRALQHWGKTDVRFLILPGEPHNPTSRSVAHRRRVLEEQLAWLDKYLFGTVPPGDESLKPSSRLAAALQRFALGKIPETVRRGGIEIGRFEVTRAQFAAFDPAYKFAPGTGDYPANGIPLASARKYCEWLIKTAGAHFRLPTEEEMRGLHPHAEGENTLDYWAGYAVNTDDFRNLESAVGKLGPDVLLHPVGSFAGQGEDPIFDLGGNVAEWVLAADGSGKPWGGCAGLPADPKIAGAPKPEFIGFRVVREPTD